MARALRIRPHLADPSGGYTRIYLYLTFVHGTGPKSSPFQTGNILPACETQLVFERLMKYGSHREKFTLVRLITPRHDNIRSIEEKREFKYNSFYFSFLLAESKV